LGFLSQSVRRLLLLPKLKIVNKIHRRQAFLYLALGSIVGLALLLIEAPLWTFYLAPLLTVPVMLAALRTEQNGRGREPFETGPADREPVHSAR
jgi:hypothetical protein